MHDIVDSNFANLASGRADTLQPSMRRKATQYNP